MKVLEESHDPIYYVYLFIYLVLCAPCIDTLKTH